MARAYSRIIFVSSDDAPLVKQLARALADHFLVDAKSDGRLPLIRISTTAIVTLPAKGVNAPAPPEVKPVQARSLPWMPSTLLWIAADELHKRKIAQREGIAFSQTVKVEIITLASTAQSIVLIGTRPGLHPAEDFLLFDFPVVNAAITRSVVAREATEEELLEAIESADPYVPNRTLATKRRFRSELDYVVATNLNVGLSHKLKAAKVGPKTGVHLSLIQAGIIAAIDDVERRRRMSTTAWACDIVVESRGGIMLGASLDPAPAPGTSYTSLIARRPAIGMRASIQRMQDTEVTLAPPPAMTIGGLITLALRHGADELRKLPDALRFLHRIGAISDPGWLDSRYAALAIDVMKVVLAQLAQHGLAQAEPRALQEQLERGEPPATFIRSARSALMPLLGSSGAQGALDLTPFHRDILRAVTTRWAQAALGPATLLERTITLSCAGQQFSTKRYRVDRAGWLCSQSVPALLDLDVGQTLTVCDNRVEPIIRNTPPNFGEIFDALTQPDAQTPQWRELCLPKATLASSFHTLSTIQDLLKQEIVAIERDTLRLTPLGQQLVACLPPILRNPAFAVNLRSAARNAAGTQTEGLVKADMHAMLVSYIETLKSAEITLRKSDWAEEAPSATTKPTTLKPTEEDSRRVDDHRNEQQRVRDSADRSSIGI